MWVSLRREGTGGRRRMRAEEVGEELVTRVV
jgi:hypothetical protein